jgi:hypothetical protein
MLSLEEENTRLQQQVKDLESSFETADQQSTAKLQSAARNLGLDISVLVDAILKEARKQQKQEKSVT